MPLVASLTRPAVSSTTDAVQSWTATRRLKIFLTLYHVLKQGALVSTWRTRRKTGTSTKAHAVGNSRGLIGVKVNNNNNHLGRMHQLILLPLILHNKTKDQLQKLHQEERRHQPERHHHHQLITIRHRLLRTRIKTQLHGGPVLTPPPFHLSHNLSHNNQHLINISPDDLASSVQMS